MGEMMKEKYKKFIKEVEETLGYRILTASNHPDDVSRIELIKLLAESNESMDSLELDKKEYLQLTARNLNGDCICPAGYPGAHPKASHYPGCPIVLNQKVEYLQARIDELMLEYCPDEMTKEQMDEWAKHQISVDGSTSTPTTEDTDNE